MCAVFLLGIFSTEIADTDFWWHLKTGQYVFEHHKLPVPDPFSYTSDLGGPSYHGEENVRYFNLTHEWLAQLAWYVIYAIGGFPAVVIWKALLLASVCGAAGFLAARRSANFHVGIVASLIGAPILGLFAVDRPALVSFVLVAAFVVILDGYREGGRLAWLWLLVPLQWIWANSHGGFFLGWVVLGSYAASGWSLPVQRRKSLWIVAALAVLASGLNPSGFRVFEILLAYRQSFLTRTLIEWKQPFLWGPPYTYNLLLYSTAAALVLAWRKLRLSDALLFLAFGSASLMAFRNIGFIAFLAPVLLAAYAWPLLAKLADGSSLRLPAKALDIGFLLGLGALCMQQGWAGNLYQMRVAEWKFPVGAANFLKENQVSAPIFNTYEYGGYLLWSLWPGQRTFIDGRALNESVYNDYRKILYSQGSSAQQSGRARGELLDRYGVQIVVTNAFEFVTGVTYPIALALGHASETDWQLVYQDAQALVYARDVPENRALIEKHTISKTRVGDHLESACRTYIEHDPELPNCARTLGQIFLRAGERERAREALGLYLSHIDHPDAEAQRIYRSLSGNRG